MQLTQKQWLIILSGLTILAACYWIYKKYGAKQSLPLMVDLPKVSPVVDAVRGNDHFPLKIGSRGKRVEQLQSFLQLRRGASFPKFGKDGVFQAETLENVQKYLGVSEVDQNLFRQNRISDFKTYTY